MLYALHGMARRRFDLFAISLVVLQSGWWEHWLNVSDHVACLRRGSQLRVIRHLVTRDGPRHT
ncbi:hypothetical protein, partial [Halomonas sp. 19A_GOM-1509m]|uniref:hypothetical protein n=2 Tax=unclassified Halomonas TaxID=2609666 RepID=UPI001E424259